MVGRRRNREAWLAYGAERWPAAPARLAARAAAVLARFGPPPRAEYSSPAADRLAHLLTPRKLKSVLADADAPLPAWAAILAWRATGEEHPDRQRAKALLLAAAAGFEPERCVAAIRQVAPELDQPTLQKLWVQTGFADRSEADAVWRWLEQTFVTPPAATPAGWRRPAMVLAALALLLTVLPVQQGEPPPAPPQELADSFPETASTAGEWATLGPAAGAWKAQLRALDRTAFSRSAMRRVAHGGRPVLQPGPQAPWTWRLELTDRGTSARLRKMVAELAPGLAYEWRSSLTAEGWRLAARPRGEVAAPDDRPFARIAFTGDVMFSGDLPYLVQWHGQPWPWEKVMPHRSGWDALVVNLESPLSKGGTPTRLKLASELRAKREFIFNGSPASVQPMVAVGVRAATIGNNHSIDQGAAGLRQTRQHLAAAGIATSGAGQDIDEALRPAVFTIRGVTVAVVAFCDAATLPRPETFAATQQQPGVALLFTGPDGTLTKLSRQQLTDTVRRAQLAAEVVFVTAHWGRERVIETTPAQRAIAHAAIDAGADAVIGHHPHCLQPVEWYQGRPILYSLGNFIFSGYDWEPLHRAAVARFTVDHSGVVWLDLAPVVIQRCRPGFTTQADLRNWIAGRLVVPESS